MPAIPSNARRYHRTELMADLPPGMCRPHHLKRDTWSRLYVLRGGMSLVDDDRNMRFEVHSGHFFDIPPEVVHHVESPGPNTLFSMDFYTCPDPDNTQEEAS